jgi:hypothetical protein
VVDIVGERVKDAFHGKLCPYLFAGRKSIAIQRDQSKMRGKTEVMPPRGSVMTAFIPWLRILLVHFLFLQLNTTEWVIREKRKQFLTVPESGKSKVKWPHLVRAFCRDPRCHKAARASLLLYKKHSMLTY